MKKTLILNLFFTFCTLWLLQSCSKSDATSSVQDSQSIMISDLPGDTLASVGSDVSGKERREFYPLIFSFATGEHRLIKNASDSATYLKTTDWDIAFTQQYNSIIEANNGRNITTPGYEGSGTSQMIQIDTPYDKVLSAPADEAFANESVVAAGWDNGNGVGWYFYSLTNHIAVPIKNRTFIIKTSTGKFAKLEMLNIYKGNPPTVTNLYWPAPYLTFRYFLQKDGSRNLKTN